MASRASDRDSLVGSELGHYRIAEKIGAGGMGEVYRARDQHLARDVAIKVLPPGTLADESARKHFRKEALILSQLNHPNVATIHDFDTQQGVDFLVMEHIPGITLSEKVAGRPLPEKEVLRLGVQLAEGLAAAHEHGVIHRDLKPGNLRVTSDGRLKILDFGLAKLWRPVTDTAATESLSETQAMAGTLPYMAPEQLLGEEIDACTDIHATGSVLYEMSTGQRPFAGVERSQLIGAILRRPPAPPGQLNPKLSPELQRIIGKCLEKEPENRYQSAKELGVDLRRLGLLSTTMPPVTVGRRQQHTRKWIPVTGVLLVAVCVVLFALNVLGWRDHLLGTASVPRIRSLAVLPLVDLSGDSGQEYFADGMTEELITNLGKNSTLRVISHTSVMQYRSTNKTVPTIAGELHVDAVVEGSVLRSGDRVRITAQLIQAKAERHLWGESYERPLRDVLSLQSEVARDIANEIKVKLTPQDRERARSSDPQLYELYLKGRYYWNKKTPQGLREGYEYFQRALDKDPTYALAWAGLADTYLTFANYGLEAPEDAIPKAKAAARRALELDEDLAEAHASLGMATLQDHFDWKNALIEFEFAIRLNRNYAIAYQWSSLALMAAGEAQEALQMATRAQELDPLSLTINANLGYVLYEARRYDDAIQQCQKTVQFDPNFALAHVFLGLTYARHGNLPDAIAEEQKAVDLAPGNTGMLAMLTYVKAVASQRGEVLNLLGELKNRPKPNRAEPNDIALIYAALHENDRALEYLDKAYEEGSLWSVPIKLDPGLDVLRSDPRFKNLLRRAGLPTE